MANIFFSFALKDLEVFNQLLRHLSVPAQARKWQLLGSHLIRAGESRDTVLGQLETAEAAVLLMSADYFNDEEIQTIEYPAIARAFEQKRLRVIPVVAKYCSWREVLLSSDGSTLGQLKALPDAEKPLSDKTAWGDEDKPYVQTVTGLLGAMENQPQPVKPPVQSNDHFETNNFPPPVPEWQQFIGRWAGQSSNNGSTASLDLVMYAGQYQVAVTPHNIFYGSYQDGGYWQYNQNLLQITSTMYPGAMVRSQIQWFGPNEFKATVVWATNPMALGDVTVYKRY